MALRITQKERKWLYSHNASARAKTARLKVKFNINTKFKTKAPNEFTSREELNKYKRELKVYLLRNTHAYIPGGIVSRYFSEKGIEVPFAIPKDEYLQIKRILAKRNRHVRKQTALFRKVNIDVKGKRQITKLATKISERYTPTGKMVYSYSSYKPLNINTEFITSKSTWKKFSYAVKKYQSSKSLKKKQAQMKENYKQALKNTFGRNADRLVQIIDKMTTNEFITYFESDEYIDFTYIYDEVEAYNVLNYMINHLVNFISNLNLKKLSNEDIEDVKNYYDNLGYVDKQLINQGKYEDGLRIFTDDTHYIDLKKDEVVPYLLGEIDVYSDEYSTRKHYVNRHKRDEYNYERSKEKGFKDLL